MHRHTHGTEHIHGDASGVRVLYVAKLSFTRVGDWEVGLRVSQASGELNPCVWQLP